MHRPRFRKFLFVSTLAALGLAAGSSVAQAEVYCVNDTSPACTSPQPDFQAALDLAANDPGADSVRLGPGNYANAAGFQYLASSGEVDIIGAGTSQTVITGWNTLSANETTGLNLQGAAGSEVRDLAILIPENLDNTGDTGLHLADGNDAFNLRITGPDASNARAVKTYGGNLTDSVIDLPTSFSNFGVDQNAGSPQINNDRITAEYGVRHSSTGSVTTVSRSTLVSVYGVVADGGSFAVRNSSIFTLDQPGAIGIGAYNSNNSASTISAELEGVTIVGAPGNQDSIGVLAQADSAASAVQHETANVTMRNTVISGSQTPLSMRAGHTWGTVNVTSDYSAYDFSKVQIQPDVGGAGTGIISYPAGTGRIDLSGGPQFIDPLNGDYTPEQSSVLVDAGDPAAPSVGETDILGHRRDCNGTPGGAFRRDIGAFEYNDCINPETSIVSISTEISDPGVFPSSFSITFRPASSKSPSTFSCSFDGGTPFSCGPEVVAPDLGPGQHTFSVQATDQYGNVDPTPATHTYVVPEPTLPSCGNTPSLCPPEGDTTPPRVLKLKAPKKTKAKRVKVTFKSNEAGVIFTCRLNKGTPKRCKSPWKTPKLKKGRNSVQVWATDKSGNRSGIKRVTVKRR